MRQRGLLAVFLFTLASVGTVQAEDKKDEEAIKKALKDMQGSWELVSLVADGKELKAPEGTKRILTIDGTKYSMKANDEAVGGGTFKVVSAGKLIAFDTMPSDGPNKDKTQKAICEIKGDDMKGCLAQPDKDRPTELESKAGSGHVLIVYKRVKK